MLTSNLLRVRLARDRVIPLYLDAGDLQWLDIASQLREVYLASKGRTRGELEDELTLITEGNPQQLVCQGLAKLLEDRCAFEVVSGHPPEELREKVFTAAAAFRNQAVEGQTPFDRQSILAGVATELGLSVAQVDQGLFADLKSEQHLIDFDDIAPERLLERYNVALAQAALFKSTRVQVELGNEKPARLRQLLRLAKFHRLICDVRQRKPDGLLLELDGPLSLFSATQKYGVQLALFLPAVLQCQQYHVRAELLWGPKRGKKILTVDRGDGLVSHQADRGTYVPPELGMFVELFRKRVDGWDIAEELEAFPLGDSFWVPDFVLINKATGKRVCLEVLGFWRRSSLDLHLERLRRHATMPFVLAVSDQLHVEEQELRDIPARIHRFRQMPLPDEVVALAESVSS